MIYLLPLFLLYKESPGFIISYQPQDEKAASDVLRLATSELPRILTDLGLEKIGKIKICLISSKSELKEIKDFPDWGIGCAYPRQQTILLKSPRIVKYPIELRTIVAHELSHIVLGSILHNIRVPRWFDEGIAMYESGEWKPGESMRLSWANFTHSILPLSSIEHKFPTQSEKARLAYVESFSTISFIINEFGKEGLEEVIQSLGQGNSFEQALDIVLGLGYADFELEWEKWVKERYNGFQILFKFFPWGLILIIFFIVVFLNTKRRQEKLRRLDFEEPDLH